METRNGLTGSLLREIFFTEESYPSVSVIKHLHIEISRQNSNLMEVKEKMAVEAKSIGANTIVNFRYGQQAHKRLDLIFSFKWDTESWYGEGDAVNI